MHLQRFSQASCINTRHHSEPNLTHTVLLYPFNEALCTNTCHPHSACIARTRGEWARGGGREHGGFVGWGMCGGKRGGLKRINIILTQDCFESAQNTAFKAVQTS